MMRGFCIHLVLAKSKRASVQPSQVSGEGLPGAADTVTGSSVLAAELVRRLGQLLERPVRELSPLCVRHLRLCEVGVAEA